MSHIKVCLQMIKEKLSKNWLLYLFTLIVIFVFAISVYSLFRFSWNYNKRLYDHIMSIENTSNDNTLTIPEGSEIFIVQPNGEQEVVIIGNPENIKVKPKKK